MACVTCVTDAAVACSRCGLKGHRAQECSKPFLAVTCAYCKKSGHTEEGCKAARAARNAAEKAAFAERELRRAREDAYFEELRRGETYEERQHRRAEEKVAYELRQQRRADAARRHAEWLSAHPCWRCGQVGHTRESCPVKSLSEPRDNDPCSDISSVRSLASSTPESTASTASTVAALPKRGSALPDKCGFCGAKRLEQTKHKAHVNSSKERCHSCWRAF